MRLYYFFSLRISVFVIYAGQSSRERRNRRNRQWPEYVRHGHMSRVQSGYRGKLQKSELVLTGSLKR